MADDEIDSPWRPRVPRVPGTDQRRSVYPQRTLTGTVTAEGGPWFLDIDLPLTTSAAMAQRIAKIELLRARSRRRFSIELDLRGLAAQPGDIVTFSAPEIGMEEATFEVDAFAFARRDGSNGTPVLGTRLDLIEYSAATFAWSPDDELTGDTGNANPGGLLNAAPENACYNELGLDLFVPGRWMADYHLQWDDPAMEDLPLDFIRAEILITIRWSYDDGLGGAPVEVTTTVSHSADILAGVEVYAIEDLISEPGLGYTYIEHTPDITLRAFYADGRASGPSPLGACPLTELVPHGYPIYEGILPAQLYPLVEVFIDGTRLYRGGLDPSFYIIVYSDTGIATLWDDTTIVAERPADDSGGPAGVYLSTLYGQANYNADAPFTYIVTLTP